MVENPRKPKKPKRRYKRRSGSLKSKILSMKDFVETLIAFGIIVGLCLWGLWELVDWLWIDDAIRTTEQIVPEIELVVKDNVVDTIYVYRMPY